MQAKRRHTSEFGLQVLPEVDESAESISQRSGSDQGGADSRESSNKQQKQEPDPAELKPKCKCKSRVLIVDDSQFQIYPLQNLLRKHFGLSCDTAQNGRTAFHKVKRNLTKQCCGTVYNLILMDLRMPIMDGPTASKNILAFYNSLNGLPKFREFIQPLKIFAATSYADTGNVKSATDAGMTRVLVKPVDLTQLSEALAAAEII